MHYCVWMLTSLYHRPDGRLCSAKYNTTSVYWNHGCCADMNPKGERWGGRTHCWWERLLYLAATLARSIGAGTHLPLQVAGLAVWSCHVTLTLGALWGMFVGGRQHQASVITSKAGIEEPAECVLALCFTKPMKSKIKMLCYCHFTPMSGGKINQQSSDKHRVQFFLYLAEATEFQKCIFIHGWEKKQIAVKNLRSPTRVC